MNVWQLSQQIVFALNQANFVWPDAPSEPVLSRVIVGPPPPDFFQHDLVAPAAILHVETERDHDEHPADLVEEARWSLYLFAANATEQAGSAAVMGGNRATLGSSRGRGLLEIEPLVKARLFSQLGLTARPRSVGSQPTNSAGKMGGVIAERALDLMATRCPNQTDFAPVRKLKATTPAVSPYFTILTVFGNFWQFTINPDSTPVVLEAGIDFTYSLTTPSVTATNLANAINANGTLGPLVSAVAVGSVVTVSVTTATTLALSVFDNGGTPGFATATTPAGSSVSLTFAPAVSRYDLIGYTWVRAAGPVAPASPAGGTFVANPAAIGLLDAPGAGTWSYSVFWAYDTTRDPFTGVGVAPADPNRWSSYETAQGGVVYVPASVTVTV